MSKFLLLLLVFVVAWWLIRRVRGGGRAGDARDTAAPGPVSEQMVTCSHCGLYLPQQEAIAEGGEFYCCAEHRRRAG